jgi:hypothetical protein
LLNGLMLVMIHRLDLAQTASAGDTGPLEMTADTARQVVWTAVAVALFVRCCGGWMTIAAWRPMATPSV